MNLKLWPRLKIIFEVYKKEVKILTINDVDIDTTQVGLKASPTRVFRSFTPEVKGGGIILEGSEKEVASKLVGEFKDAHII